MIATDQSSCWTHLRGAIWDVLFLDILLAIPSVELLVRVYRYWTENMARYEVQRDT